MAILYILFWPVAATKSFFSMVVALVMDLCVLVYVRVYGCMWVFVYFVDDTPHGCSVIITLISSPQGACHVNILYGQDLLCLCTEVQVCPLL